MYHWDGLVGGGGGGLLQKFLLYCMIVYACFRVHVVVLLITSQ